MSILDKLRDPQPADDLPQRGSATAPRPRLPEPVSSARDIARIGSTITIRGDLSGAESLVIDCRVEGTVSLTGYDLTIGQTGYVGDDVSASQVRIEGEVTGDITGAERVAVTQTGRVLGNIVAPRVTLEEGARFKGSIDMDPGPAAVRQSLRSSAEPGDTAGADRGTADSDPAPTSRPEHPASAQPEEVNSRKPSSPTG